MAEWHDGLRKGSHSYEVVPPQAGVIPCLAVSSEAAIAVPVHWLAGWTLALQ